METTLKTLRLLADTLLKQTGRDHYLVVAPCFELDGEVHRCLPAGASFWTFYVSGKATFDVASADAAVALLSVVWDGAPVETHFDFGTHGFEAKSLPEARENIKRVGRPSQGFPMYGNIAKGLLPLYRALDEAASNHGKLNLISRLDASGSILCNIDPEEGA
jgi:hypothetical protein